MRRRIANIPQTGHGRPSSSMPDEPAQNGSDNFRRAAYGLPPIQFSPRGMPLGNFRMA